MSDSSKDDSFGHAVFAFVISPFLVALLLPLMALTTWQSAYVSSVLWSWFAVPSGLPAITTTQAALPFLLFAILTSGRIATAPKDERTWVQRSVAMATYLLCPWAILAVGWWLR